MSKLDDSDDYENLSVVVNDDLRATPGIKFAAGFQGGLFYGIQSTWRPHLGVGFNIVGPAKGTTVFLGILRVK